jgi:hypothetical protein
MQSNDLQTEMESLNLRILDQERILDQALARNLELRETKKIYHELKLLKEKMTRLSELFESSSPSV